MFEVVEGALMNFLYNQTLKFIKLTHYKGKVIALHLRAYVFLNGVDFQVKHRKELILTLKGICYHGDNVLEDEIFFISKIINAVNGSSG